MSYQTSQLVATISCNIVNSTLAHMHENLVDSIWILINARLIYTLNSSIDINSNHGINIINVPLSENRYSIAIYTRYQARKNFHLIGVNDIDIFPSNISHDAPASNNIHIPSIDYRQPYATLSKPVLSTYYTTINYYVAMAWQNVTYNMEQLNMNTSNVHAPNFETVIDTDDNITMYDLNNKWAWTINASKHSNSSIKPVQQNPGWIQLTPSNFGYYCVYTNPDKNTNLVPDCPNVTDIITEHGKILYSSGIDFILPDDTNKDGGYDDISSYILQIRPNEVLYQTWTQLRLIIT